MLRQSSEEQRVALPLVSRAPPMASPQKDDDAGALRPRPQAAGDVPKRKSSFVGLPPIRRSSPFGLITRAKRASQRFSFDHDNVNDHEDDGSVSFCKDGSRLGDPEESGPLGSSPTLQAGYSIKPALGGDAIKAFPFAKEEEPRGLQDRGSRSGPEDSKLQASQLSSPSSAGAGLSVDTRLSLNRPPLLASPILGLADGPWKLEESHLSEPLHTVTRHRPETGSSQQHMFYGYDKETDTPEDPRQRSFDVPPSSAYRWPDLFHHPISHDVQRPQSRSRPMGSINSHTRMEPPLQGETESPRPIVGEPPTNASQKLKHGRRRSQQGLHFGELRFGGA